MRTWQIDLTRDVAPLTPNRRRHWRAYQSAVKEWREVARLAVIEAGVPALPAVRMVLCVYPPDRRRRDSDNLVPYLLKPVKDGVVDAGVVPDDTDRYVSWSVGFVPVETHPPDGRWHYWLYLDEEVP